MMRSGALILFTQLSVISGTGDEIDDNDEVGLLQLHHNNAQRASTTQPTPPRISIFTSKTAQDPSADGFAWDLGPHDDDIFGTPSTLGSNCWTLYMDVPWGQDAAGNPVQHAALEWEFRGDANAVWSVSTDAVEDVPNGGITQNPRCFMDWGSVGTAAATNTPQKWCARKGEYCVDGDGCANDTPGQCANVPHTTPPPGVQPGGPCNERADGTGCQESAIGAYKLLRDGIFAGWSFCESYGQPTVRSNHNSGGKGWNRGSCADTCKSQREDDCFATCSCISLLDQPEYTIDQGDCVTTGGVSITDAAHCAYAAQRLGLTMHNARPSVPINAAGGYFGCIYDVDVEEITGQSLWLNTGATNRNMPENTAGGQRKQICTPKVARVVGSCAAGDTRKSSYANIQDTDSCTKAAQMLSSPTFPLTGFFDDNTNRCFADAARFAELCTATW